MAKRKRKTGVRNLALGLFAATLAGMAIREQLRRPPEERTWHGKVLGFPYDFRPPTIERLRATMWNEHTSQIFLPHAFGIGWSLNLYPIIHPKTLDEQHTLP
ncbi:MAG TPA: hypothetical protein VKX46_20130 [Ktedonobacteraceae bacterium]|nr:hypothetical protein [Ktedonobacteraceae bacterium]